MVQTNPGVDQSTHIEHASSIRQAKSKETIVTWLQRVGKFTIILSAIALLVALISLPHTTPIGWGWSLLITGFIALGVALAISRLKREVVSQATNENFLFNHTDSSPLWLAVRVYLGSVWLAAGLAKLLNPKWTQGGAGLKGFWAKATLVQAGVPSVVPYAWYRDLLHFMLTQQWYVWFAWVIAIGEFAIGALLLLGLFTGLTALAGGTLNLLYLTAGAASTNPVMLIFPSFCSWPGELPGILVWIVSYVQL